MPRPRKYVVIGTHPTQPEPVVHGTYQSPESAEALAAIGLRRKGWSAVILPLTNPGDVPSMFAAVEASSSPEDIGSLVWCHTCEIYLEPTNVGSIRYELAKAIVRVHNDWHVSRLENPDEA